VEKALGSIFALGWIDIFNPVAISMVLILVTSVRKRRHILIYIFGAYAAYALASIAIFFGVDRYLADLIKRLIHQFPMAYGITLMITGLAALAGCAAMVVSLVRAIRNKRELTIKNMLPIKSVAPWFILLLAFGSTWSCMFSAFAMMAFIGVLVYSAVSMVSAIWLICVFCLFSLIPTMSIYVLASRVKEKRFTRIMQTVSKITNGFCMYSIPVVLAALSCWSLITGIDRLTGLN